MSVLTKKIVLLAALSVLASVGHSALVISFDLPGFHDEGFWTPLPWTPLPAYLFNMLVAPLSSMLTFSLWDGFSPPINRWRCTVIGIVGGIVVHPVYWFVLGLMAVVASFGSSEYSANISFVQFCFVCMASIFCLGWLTVIEGAIVGLVWSTLCKTLRMS